MKGEMSSAPKVKVRVSDQTKGEARFTCKKFGQSLHLVTQEAGSEGQGRGKNKIQVSRIPVRLEERRGGVSTEPGTGGNLTSPI